MMTDTKRMRIAYLFRLIGRYGLLLLLLPIVLFSFVSGAEGFGGAWLGVIKDDLHVGIKQINYRVNCSSPLIRCGTESLFFHSRVS
jgi:hypothetical protein